MACDVGAPGLMCLLLDLAAHASGAHAGMAPHSAPDVVVAGELSLLHRAVRSGKQAAVSALLTWHRLHDMKLQVLTLLWLMQMLQTTAHAYQLMSMCHSVLKPVRKHCVPVKQSAMLSVHNALWEPAETRRCCIISSKSSRDFSMMSSPALLWWGLLSDALLTQDCI